MERDGGGDWGGRGGCYVVECFDGCCLVFVRRIWRYIYFNFVFFFCGRNFCDENEMIWEMDIKRRDLKIWG